jgi:hypothetical protein
MAGAERRKGERVTFERGIPAHMMGIDGTWRRDCTMEDVSETGAKLTVEGSVGGLHLKEFFLLLSSPGLPIAAASRPGSMATRSASISSSRATRRRRPRGARRRRPEPQRPSYGRHVR